MFVVQAAVAVTLANLVVVIATAYFSSDTVSGVQKALPCIKADFGYGSTVCVCNATYCDTVEPLLPIPSGSYAVYLSSKVGHRLDKTVHSFKPGPSASEPDVVIKLDKNTTYQTILGFGGAFTDATGINVHKLSPDAQENLLKSYFHQTGIEYTLGRIPMAGTDFSTHKYSYDDTPGDLQLRNFSLVNEDIKYKIPLVQAAQKMSKNKITLFASPWSAPAWMKTNNDMAGMGQLIGEPGGKYYKAWAKYFVRFLEEYKKQKISFWGLTAQNEPTDGMLYNFPFNAMGFTAEQQRDFIAKDLGPALHLAGYDKIKLMILDDNRLMLTQWAEVILSNPDAAQYVSGIAVHWYLDFLVPSKILSITHEQYPDSFILATEACRGQNPWDESVTLGKWSRGEDYAHSIIQDVNNWAIGWTDWNMALDMKGGPNWAENFVDSPVIVNYETDEFYKQPMFYAMGHFSKFLRPGSKRIGLSISKTKCVEVAGFITPENLVVVTVLNRNDEDYVVSIKDDDRGYANIFAMSHTLQTLVWSSQA